MNGEELAGQVAALLGQRTVATAESVTAGRVAATFACVEKAAEFLRGGLVAYQEEVKRSLLGVSADSVLSLEAASQMAAGVARLLGAEVTVATTGVAGDDSEEGTPSGTVYIGTSVDGRVGASVHRFEGSPEDICDQASRQALIDLRQAMAGGTRPAG